MAIKKVQKNRMNDEGTYDVIHYETDASVVLMEDGTTVQSAIDSAQSKLTFDEAPTVGSDNLVTSSGIAEAIEGLVAKDGSVAMTGVFQMGGNRISDVGEPSGDNDAVRKVDLAGKADLVSGKVPAEQLPDMDYAPASHAQDTANPHRVTAAQVEAVPYLPVYYKDGMSADDLLVPFALIPSDSSNNAELNAIVGGTYAYVHTNFYGSASVTSRRQQIAMSYNSITPKMAYRIYGANGWLPWKAVATEDYAVAVGFYDGDLDLLTADGHYRLGGNVTNGPSGAPYAWCQIIVTHGVNTDTNAQILVDNTGRIYSRIYWAGEWKAWISNVSKSGDTMRGGLNFQPVGVTGYTQMYKNATSDSADYGTLMIDRASAGKMIGLKLYAAAQKAIIFDNTNEYDLYHAGNKPTAADIGAAKTTTYTATVSTGWTASGNYYYKDVSVPGLLATDDPIADVVLGGDAAADELYKNAWALIDRIETADNWITVYSVGAAPAVAFMVRLKVVR